jgi:type VI secretion system VasD/TssJ family lipoprotein
MRSSLGLMLGMVLAVSTGCPKQIVVPCEPRLVRLNLIASDRLNPDNLGRSLVTTLALYQLKDPTRLENASFTELWRDPKGTLKEDLLETEELTISPAERVARELTPKAGVTHLAVVALVRKPVGTAWRRTRNLVPSPELMCTDKRPRLDPLELSFLLEEFEVRDADSAASPVR